MGEADIVIYVKGFQPSLDQAVESISGPTIIDLSDQVDLEPLASGEESHSDEDHEADSHEDEHDHGDLDPHFWLDPVRMQSAADGVQQALSEASPDNSQLFESNLSALDTELLDASYIGIYVSTIFTPYIA